jgi:hypothetical protein
MTHRFWRATHSNSALTIVVDIGVGRYMAHLATAPGRERLLAQGQLWLRAASGTHAITLSDVRVARCMERLYGRQSVCCATSC